MIARAGRVCLLLAIVIFAGSGCLGVPPAPADLHSVPIGPAQDNYDAQIREYFKPSLLDPYSAVYELRSPVRGWETDKNGVMKVFWAVCGTVNAKNRFGGYVGQRPLLAIFDQGRMVGGLIDHDPPKNWASVVVERCRAWSGARQL